MNVRLNREPDGSFVSTPIYAGVVSQAALLAAHADCEHVWETVGPADTIAIPGCTMQTQRCNKCRLATRVTITGPKAALDAFAGTLHKVETPDAEPSAN
jgi:hypothetical protein